MQTDIYWTNKDIRDYVGCGVNKASQIRKEAILHHDGFIPLLPRKVKKQAVLKALENIKRKKRN